MEEEKESVKEIKDVQKAADSINKEISLTSTPTVPENYKIDLKSFQTPEYSLKIYLQMF